MYTLIIIDDEDEIRNGLKRYFPWDMVGFHVVGDFSNAQKAYEFIKENDVDVVISDISMPEMSGIDLARKIYEDKINTRVVFLSAYKKFEYAQDAITYKVVHYITKPTVYSEIMEVFQSIRESLDEINKPAKVSGENTYTNMLITKITDIMEKDIKNVTLVSVADELGRSPSSISRLFSEIMGKTFTDYLTEMRMEKANDYLNNYDYKVYEICEMVGYTNAKNFTRAYKKYFGRTPREIRSTSDNM